MLPNHFAGLNFKKLTMALDLNGNGIIEETEFMSVMQKAISSGLETSNLTKFSQSMSGSQNKAQSNPGNTESVELKVLPHHRLTHVTAI